MINSLHVLLQAQVILLPHNISHLFFLCIFLFGCCSFNSSTWPGRRGMSLVPLVFSFNRFHSNTSSVFPLAHYFRWAKWDRRFFNRLADWWARRSCVHGLVLGIYGRYVEVCGCVCFLFFDEKLQIFLYLSCVIRSIAAFNTLLLLGFVAGISVFMAQSCRSSWRATRHNISLALLDFFFINNCGAMKAQWTSIWERKKLWNRTKLRR